MWLEVDKCTLPVKKLLLWRIISYVVGGKQVHTTCKKLLLWQIISYVVGGKQVHTICKKLLLWQIISYVVGGKQVHITCKNFCCDESSLMWFWVKKCTLPVKKQLLWQIISYVVEGKQVHTTCKNFCYDESSLMPVKLHGDNKIARKVKWMWLQQLSGVLQHFKHSLIILCCE